MDETILAMWESHSIWEIAVRVQGLVGRRITSRQIWGAHQRLDVAKREVEKN